MGNKASRLQLGSVSSARLISCFQREGGDWEKTVRLVLMGAPERVVARYLELVTGEGDFEEFRARFVEAHEKIQMTSSSEGVEEADHPVDLTRSLHLSVESARQQEEEEEEEEEAVEEDVGHVFCLLTDLRRLACDTWAIPTGPSLCPSQHWLKRGDAADEVDEALRDYERFKPATDTQMFARVPVPEGRPQPFCVNTHATGTGRLPRRNDIIATQDTRGVHLADLTWVHTATLEYLDAALEYTKEANRIPLNGRRKYLIAMPLFAAGGAGARSFTGQLVREILPVLLGFARGNDVDVALVTNERPIFCVIQAERARFSSAAFCQLSSPLKEHASRLAQRALEDKLVLFLGAGVSMAAGLPSWGALLRGLAQETGMDAQDIASLGSLDYLDQARLVASRLERGEEELAELVAARCSSPSFALAHALLAVLPVRECCSTNYDILFEEASKAVDRSQEVVTLPYEVSPTADRIVLKLHGDVRFPHDIVLTREHYLRYESRRQALAGMVQALLITKHMLFVGFSLQDTNFHKIMDSVKLAVGDKQNKFGTSLFLLDEPFLQELWQRELHVVPMSSLPKGQKPQGEDWSKAARKLEVFLDYVAHLASQTGEFLLDTKMGAVLSHDEILTRNYIQQFLDDAPKEVRASPYWKKLRELIGSNFGRM